MPVSMLYCYRRLCQRSEAISLMLRQHNKPTLGQGLCRDDTSGPTSGKQLPTLSPYFDLMRYALMRTS